MKSLSIREPFPPISDTRRHRLTRAIMHIRMHHQVILLQPLPFMHFTSKAWLSTQPERLEYTRKF
jgi:hypothetical protein